MSARERAVVAARAAVGARYRLQGREIEYGLDCVGLTALAMRAAGYKGPVPSGYALRGGLADDFLELIDTNALIRTDRPAAGDVLLFATGPGQFHLAVKSVGGFVHADAMLRRVVERPDPAPWPLVAAWALVDADAAEAMLAR
ncbi:C40 family peptidase [Sphingomonas aliaeris]|uniref:C40 family peptidase n=1 Tax=Sphingomonas aliaeris TaxID=2759526 RepID=A0A974NV93_9SPHN|nr:NlpC/P60 family protein [Sphingomonas aliaeris]QQV77520.1 C40 family peptidase [Sphingomonas aliaeris]